MLSHRRLDPNRRGLSPARAPSRAQLTDFCNQNTTHEHIQRSFRTPPTSPSVALRSSVSWRAAISPRSLGRRTPARCSKVRAEGQRVAGQPSVFPRTSGSPGELHPSLFCLDTPRRSPMPSRGGDPKPGGPSSDPLIGSPRAASPTLLREEPDRLRFPRCLPPLNSLGEAATRPPPRAREGPRSSSSANAFFHPPPRVVRDGTHEVMGSRT